MKLINKLKIIVMYELLSLEKIVIEAKELR